jgi:hypothetical protein
MTDDEFTPEEQALINRLKNASQRPLSPRAYQAIQAKILAELTNPSPPPSPSSGGSGFLSFPPLHLALGSAAAGVVLVIGVMIVLGQLPLPFLTISQGATVEIATLTKVPTITPTPTVSPTATASATMTASATSTNTVTPTETVTVTATATSTATATAAVTASATPTVTIPLTPTATATEVVVIMEGTVDEVQANVIILSGMPIIVPENHPLLEMIDAGDTLRIEAVPNSDGRLEARVIDNLVDPTNNATVGLVGPVEAIAGNIVTINGVEVVFAVNDPLLATLEVGDFLNVEGNVELQGAVYLLVVVRAERLTTAAQGIAPNCYFEESGMGMGMGMGR